jgi:hypothetical protein
MKDTEYKPSGNRIAAFIVSFVVVDSLVYYLFDTYVSNAFVQQYQIFITMILIVSMLPILHKKSFMSRTYVQGYVFAALTIVVFTLLRLKVTTIDSGWLPLISVLVALVVSWAGEWIIKRFYCKK